VEYEEVVLPLYFYRGKMNMFILESNRLKLRPFVLSDSKKVQELAGDIEIARTTLHIPYPYPDGGAEEWISTHKDGFERGSYTFAIESKEDECLIGCIAIGVTKQHNRAELAYWIGQPYWGKGYATEASSRIVQFGFDELGLNKIWAAAFTRNPASSGVMKKLGMKYEGTFAQHILKWDKYEDLEFYGILKSDYQLKRN
jgi:ribosomal-protein-alanine N-acetyltransferase